MGALVVSLGGFIGVFCATCALFRTLLDWANPITRRLMASIPSQAAAQRWWQPPLQRARQWAHAGLDRVLRLLIVKPRSQRLGARSLRDTVIMWALLAVAGSLSATLASRGLAILSMPPSVVWAGSLVALWSGMWMTVHAWRRIQIRHWAEEISNGLIDVLDLWVLCLGSGMSFQTAMVRVTQDTELTPPALQRELLLTHQEMMAGCPREEALRHLARRCGDSPEMRTLISHVVQSERLGSGLAQTMRVHAQSLRFKRTQDTKELIQKLPVKLAFPLIFCILPSLFVVILGPAIMRLFSVLSDIRH